MQCLSKMASVKSIVKKTILLLIYNPTLRDTQMPAINSQFQYMAYRNFFSMYNTTPLLKRKCHLSLTDFKGGNMAANNPKILFWEHSANTCSGLGVTAFSVMGF